MSRPETVPLLRAYWEEMERHKSIRQMAPNVAALDKLQQADRYVVITANVDGQMIGFLTYVIMPMAPHRYGAGALGAQNDMWYVRPDYRRADIAFKMVGFAEKLLHKRGCVLMLHTDPRQRSMAPLLSHLGFDPIETVYEKMLRPS